MSNTSGHKKVLIVGDVMLDRYVIADDIRKSPEANIPLVYNYHFDDRLGGAGNVAINLKGLEIEPVLFGLSGDDEYAQILESLCQIHGLQHYFLTDSNRPTTLKARIVDAEFNQMFRMDREQTNDMDSNVEDSVISALESLIEGFTFDAIIIQDYNKGLLTESVIKFLQEKSSALTIPLLVDPKHNNFRILTHCSLFKPNLKELSTAVGYSITPDSASIRDALDKLECPQNTIFMVTLAEHGIFYSRNTSFGIIPGMIIEKPDVSGAGDTVLAVLTYGLINDFDTEEMANLGNLAGSLVCQKPGIQAISLHELNIKSA